MTEYWVSQAKHYCKVCNCWIADTKTSRQNHEASVRHKKNTDNLVKQKRKDALHGARNDQELRQQLAAIEKAAMASVQTDKLKSTAPMYSSMSINRSSSSGWNSSGPPKQEPVPTIKKEENNGIYTIRGKVYLDGRIFEDKLQRNIQCEVFVEEIDEWLPATIVHRHEKPIPNTSITLKSFDVEYVITTPDGAETRELENDIRSDRLRIPSSEKGEGYQVYEGYTPAPLPVQSVIQETTGLGGWQTVSVKVVDETKEWEEHQAAIEEMRKDQSELVLPENSGKALEDDGAIRGKVYKGFVIEDVAVEAKFNRSLPDDNDHTEVTFKKRKLNSGSVENISSEDKKDTAPTNSEGIIKPKVRNIRKKDSS